MRKIVLAGGTGQLGQLLKAAFVQRGEKVTILTRGEKKSHHPLIQYVHWDAQRLGEWIYHLEHADVLINLCGDNIRKRFTETNKKKLRDSRLGPTALLGKAIDQLDSPPNLWINFSGISLFNGLGSIQDEYSTVYGHDFLANLVLAWEDEFKDAVTSLTEKIIVRVSSVLSWRFGMLPELYGIVKKGLGGKIGKGQQYVSWIHEQDLVALIMWIIEKEKRSLVYHACSPFPERNEIFMKTLREVAGIGFGLPLPTPLVKIGAFIKGVDPSLSLETVPVTTKRTIEEGFEFKFPYLHNAFYQFLKST